MNRIQGESYSFSTPSLWGLQSKTAHPGHCLPLGREWDSVVLRAAVLCAGGNTSAGRTFLVGLPWTAGNVSPRATV